MQSSNILVKVPTICTHHEKSLFGQVTIIVRWEKKSILKQAPKHRRSMCDDEYLTSKYL